jgi:AraC-like DNA-binding protein
MRVPPAPDRIRAWKPAVPGISEVFHADYASYAYPAHAHATWTLFIVDEGVVRYDVDRHAHGSDTSMVTLLPPHVAHDGRPATPGGYRMRVLYLDEPVLGERLIGPAVDRPVVADPSLRPHLAGVHELLDSPDDELEAESRVAFVFERLRGHLGDLPESLERSRTAATAEHLRALLDDDLAAKLTLDTAGRQIGASPAHLVRCFTRTFGLPPHAYRIARRIEEARLLLLDGHPVADAAITVGFYDQAHFTRHFRRLVGTTPRRYVVSGVPASN